MWERCCGSAPIGVQWERSYHLDRSQLVHNSSPDVVARAGRYFNILTNISIFKNIEISICGYWDLQYQYLILSIGLQYINNVYWKQYFYIEYRISIFQFWILDALWYIERPASVIASPEQDPPWFLPFWAFRDNLRLGVNYCREIRYRSAYRAN